MRDIKITKAIINERRELSLNLLIKEGDYSEIEAELFRHCKIDGDTVDLELAGYEQAENEEELKKSRQSLALVMQDYAKSFHYKIEDVEKQLYTRKKVTSRSDLSLEELQEEIESYRTAIRTGQP